MILKLECIDLSKLADELAINAVAGFYTRIAPKIWTVEQVKDFLNKETPLPKLVGYPEHGKPAFVKALYEKKYDYYYKILSNYYL